MFDRPCQDALETRRWEPSTLGTTRVLLAVEELAPCTGGSCRLAPIGSDSPLTEGEDDMKYMLMMFGNAGEMMATASPEWIGEMIGFMTGLDEDLRTRGELVFNAGLADSSAATLVHADGLVTDGPFAEAKESLIGFWVVDVESASRVNELAASIAKYSQVVEVRPIAEQPPEV